MEPLNRHTACPVCSSEVQVAERAPIRETFRCKECGSALEITDLEPLAVSETYWLDEDWGE